RHPTPTLFPYTTLFRSRRYAVQARRAARELEFDVIHAHDWLTAVAASAIAADSKRPWVWHVHATEFDRAGEHGDVRVVDDTNVRSEEHTSELQSLAYLV